MALFAGTTLYWDMSVRLELLMTGYWCSVDDTENDSSLAGLKQQQPPLFNLCSWIWLGWIFEIIVVILHIMAINKDYQSNLTMLVCVNFVSPTFRRGHCLGRL